jgi:hypothetical protein
MLTLNNLQKLPHENHRKKPRFQTIVVQIYTDCRRCGKRYRGGLSDRSMDSVATCRASEQSGMHAAAQTFTRATFSALS